jgi:hypothetical protein
MLFQNTQRFDGKKVEKKVLNFIWKIEKYIWGLPANILGV